MPETLRERRRQELLERVRDIAQQHLVEHGPAALSLRAVARDAGISVSALYRYFADRDALLTDLLVRAFDAHAEAVEAALEAAGEAAGEALPAALRAYRAWAVAHPAEFGLAYGTPVPGYHAPADRTIRAGARIGDCLQGVLAREYEKGAVAAAAVEAREADLAASTREQLETLRERRGYAGPVGLTALGIDLFVTLHGFVVMEVFGQLRPVTPDAGPYFEEILAAELARLTG